jgi:hypothetical protein
MPARKDSDQPGMVDQHWFIALARSMGLGNFVALIVAAVGIYYGLKNQLDLQNHQASMQTEIIKELRADMKSMGADTRGIRREVDVLNTSFTTMTRDVDRNHEAIGRIDRQIKLDAFRRFQGVPQRPNQDSLP